MSQVSLIGPSFYCYKIHKINLNLYLRKKPESHFPLE